jgi:RNA polymerase sigma-70 factor (ECF subfamily)
MELTRTQTGIVALGREMEPEAGSDEALAARGDTDSFIVLYRKHLRPVYGYLYARLGDREEAEDLTALVFERALSGIKGYRATGSFAGWLFTIAHRTLADHYRRRRPRQIPVETQAGILLDPATGPEDQAVASDQLRRVLTIIAQLGQEQQDAISLRFMAGLPYAEIAQVMGKREAAVKMIAYRALEEIRRRCGDDI